MIVHASRQTAVALLHRSVRRHRNNRQLGEAAVSANARRSLVTVHLGHLQIHQHHVVWRRRRTLKQDVYSLAAIVRHINRRARALQEFDSDLLIDLVVFGEQDAGAAKLHVCFVDVGRCRSAGFRIR